MGGGYHVLDFVSPNCFEFGATAQWHIVLITKKRLSVENISSIFAVLLSSFKSINGNKINLHGIWIICVGVAL